MLLFCMLLSLDLAVATPLNEVEVYYRCYAQLTRTRPPTDDPRLKQVREGSVKATQACLDLINEAALDKAGGLVNQNKEKNQLALKVLRNLQSLHSSWFPLKDFIQDEVDAFTFHMFDSNEMGYHLTYNLLGPSAKASELLTRKTSFRGVRETPVQPKYFIDLSSPNQILKLEGAEWYWGAGDTKKKIEPKLVQFGNLVGLTELKPNENNYGFVKDDKSVLNFDITASLGAGIIGTRPYIMLSSNQKLDQKSDGGLNSHRSWSKLIFQDLLCRNLPVVRTEDVIGYFPDSKLSFRKSKTCMHCHVSIDPMADTVRNLFEMRSSPKNSGNFSVRVLAEHKPTLPAETEMKDYDPDFHLRPATGQLYFRNYKGELVNEKVNSIQELGQAIAKTDDFYICMAKRYFEFFTGVSVDINNLQDAELKNKSLAAHKNFVVQLGLDLKKDQSLKNTLGKIIDSEFYKDSSYGAKQ